MDLTAHFKLAPKASQSTSTSKLMVLIFMANFTLHDKCIETKVCRLTSIMTSFEGRGHFLWRVIR